MYAKYKVSTTYGSKVMALVKDFFTTDQTGRQKLNAPGFYSGGKKEGLVYYFQTCDKSNMNMMKENSTYRDCRVSGGVESGAVIPRGSTAGCYGDPLARSQVGPC